MRKLNIAFLFLILFTADLSAQQDPTFSQFMFNTLAYNPGFSGINNMFCVTALSRQQWVGFKGAPSTITFNVGAPVAPFHIKSGIGLNVMSDNLGFERDNVVSGIYSYHMDLGPGKLGIGINLGVYNMSLSPSWQIPSGDSHTPASGDPLIPENKESYVAFDAGLGAYYRTDRLYAGLSVTHINEPKIKFTKGEPYISRHYYLTTGYTLQLPNPALELLPSVFAYSDGKTLQFALNTLVRYNKKVWGGVSYRAGDALIGIFGIELYNGIRIGYSYDFTLTDIRKSSSGTHEFMVNYCFDFGSGKSPMRYKSIRFL
ncbi:MAG TPA: type IX secretion system membrane protein PorP/SprF [Bacteroidales bacterium]|nr:type IX secretion system membrane protein PorP/SprF [Bacteroidales bacterium]